MMNVKYLKNPKTKEKFYPITKSDCIIDAFSINNLEIDKLFSDSLSVSKHQKGMSYLNLQGLIHYHSKIKDYFNSSPEIDLYGYATEHWVDDNYEKKQPKPIDLGLTSGLLWANCNVGANKPEEYGDYFAWGETQPKEVYDWSTYKYCNGSYNSLTKYNNNRSYGTVDNKTTLELNDDAAHVNWGGSWRMPTDEELTELREQCTWTWTTQNGVNGYKVTGPNGNSIFLPTSGQRYDNYHEDTTIYGYYWSSSNNTYYTYYTWYMDFHSSLIDRGSNDRYIGYSVRPVCKPQNIPILNNTKTKEEIVNSTDGVYYFTTDTKQIYRNGESYGGNITAEDVETLPEEGIQVQAVTFIKNYESSSKSEFTILPNYKYVFGDRTELTIHLDSNVNQNIVNHYLFEFNSGDVATTLTLPSYIKWTSEPSIKQNKTYQISIENNLGVIQEWT